MERVCLFPFHVQLFICTPDQEDGHQEGQNVRYRHGVQNAVRAVILLTFLESVKFHWNLRQPGKVKKDIALGYCRFYEDPN